MAPTPYVCRHQSPISTLGQRETYVRTSGSHRGGHCSCTGTQGTCAHHTYFSQSSHAASNYLHTIRDMRTNRSMVTSLHAKSSYSQQPTTTNVHFGDRIGYPQVESSNGIRQHMDRKDHSPAAGSTRTSTCAQFTPRTRHTSATTYDRYLGGISTRRSTSTYNAVVMTAQSTQSSSRIQQLCMPPPHHFPLESDLHYSHDETSNDNDHLHPRPTLQPIIQQWITSSLDTLRSIL